MPLSFRRRGRRAPRLVLCVTATPAGRGWTVRGMGNMRWRTALISPIPRVSAGGAIAILATALLVATAHARDCVRETPLPADVKLTAPGANVPLDLARFAGAWTGVWDGDVCSTLLIEEVFGNGVARVVYSRGTS